MFSEKYGYKEEKQILHDSISTTLRQRVWNLFYMQDIQKGGLKSPRLTQALNGDPSIEAIIADKLGFSISSLSNGETILKKLEHHLLHFASWYDVYDFIDIHLSCLDNNSRYIRCTQYNSLLEEEKAGYRVINGEIAPITNKGEIEAIV